MNVFEKALVQSWKIFSCWWNNKYDTKIVYYVKNKHLFKFNNKDNEQRPQMLIKFLPLIWSRYTTYTLPCKHLPKKSVKYV